jgi:serine/threonine protein kinase
MHLHANNIIHRDIKPMNVLITDNFVLKVQSIHVK